MILPKALVLIKQKFLTFMRFVGTVQMFLLLAIFYYLVLGPIALIYQAYTFFQKRKVSQNSYWITRDQTKDDKQLTKQF